MSVEACVEPIQVGESESNEGLRPERCVPNAGTGAPHVISSAARSS